MTYKERMKCLMFIRAYPIQNGGCGSFSFGTKAQSVNRIAVGSVFSGRAKQGDSGRWRDIVASGGAILLWVDTSCVLLQRCNGPFGLAMNFSPPQG